MGDGITKVTITYGRDPTVVDAYMLCPDGEMWSYFGHRIEPGRPCWEDLTAEDQQKLWDLMRESALKW